MLVTLTQVYHPALALAPALVLALVLDPALLTSCCCGCCGGEAWFREVAPLGREDDYMYPHSRCCRDGGGRQTQDCCWRIIIESGRVIEW